MSCVFCCISQRALYGHLLALADAPESNPSGAKLQRAMKDMWYSLYDDPGLLGLPAFGDESYPWDVVNNQYPELNEKYLGIFKTIYEFWKFLQAMALSGECRSGALFAGKEALKAHKAAYKPAFATLLGKGGFTAKKDKTGATLFHSDGDVLPAMQQLARACEERSAAYELAWTARAHSMFDFMRCSYGGEWEYLLDRIDFEQSTGGQLRALWERCRAQGYSGALSTDCCPSSSSGFSIELSRGVGGFLITYNPRKTRKFGFGTRNGIGEKKMLENFDALDADLQRHFIDICRPCNGCMGCTRGGRARPFTVKVNLDGKDYALCPQFPNHTWPEYTPQLIEMLFKYHDLQEKLS